MNFKRSFRIVSNKNSQQIRLIEDLLSVEGYHFENDDFFTLSRRCTKEPKALGSSLAHYFGLIYIQDRASMLPPVALSPSEDSIILDVCASPGSKTSMLSTMLSEKGMVIGNEPNPTRLANLRRNLELMQCFNAITCNYTGENIPLADKSFNSILLDPPCSGWGTIDKNPNVKEIWTEEKAKNLVSLQKQLLKESVRLLKVGGEIVYSTCTTNIQENEEQVLFAINELGLELIELDTLPQFEMDTPLMNLKGIWRLEPKHKDTQGFFVAKFRKKEDVPLARTVERTENIKNFESLHVPELEHYEGSANVFGKNLYFVPDSALKLAENNEYFKFQGINIGKCAGFHSQLSAKLRIFDSSEDKIIFESKDDISKIYGLLSGQSLNYDGKSNIVPFYWKDLYLGNLTKKGKRLLWVTK